MIPYTGWECKTCKSGNPIPRNRCRKCGRKQDGTEERKVFYKRLDRRASWKRTSKRVGAGMQRSSPTSKG